MLEDDLNKMPKLFGQKYQNPIVRVVKSIQMSGKLIEEPSLQKYTLQ